MKNYGINSQEIYAATIQGLLACSAENLQYSTLEKSAPALDRIKNVADQITETFITLIGEFEQAQQVMLYNQESKGLILATLTGMLTHPRNMQICDSIHRLCTTIIFTALNLHPDIDDPALANSFAVFAHQREAK